MANDLQTLDFLATNFLNLRTLKTLDEKCSLLLDTIRLCGWKNVSLSFLNSKYETKKTLYAGFTPEKIQIAEQNRISPQKRKELLSSQVDRWRISPFYYLPWRDEKARLILTGGIKTEIPIELKREWNKRDLLYAPIYVEARPVAVLTLDEPVNTTEPNKVNLRVPTIIHSLLFEIINRYYEQEYSLHFHQIQKKIIDMGTVGLLELDIENKIIDVNIAAEQLLKKSKEKLLKFRFEKIPSTNWYEQVSPLLTKAMETLEPQSGIITYTPYEQTYKLEIHFLPIHKMFDYWGMLCTVTPSEKSEIFSFYRKIIDTIALVNRDLQGEPASIQAHLVDLLCKQYNLTYPRLYLLNRDHSQLDCIYSYDPSLTDLSLFNHAFNRNSLAANAIIDNRVVFTSIREPEVRDLRKIWDYLGTKAAVAIPIIISEDLKGALVCDADVENFFLDDSLELLLSLIGNLIALTLKSVIKS